VGGSRIRSIVKRPALRAADGYRHASVVDLAVRVTIPVDRTRRRVAATKSGWTACQTAQCGGPVTGAMTNTERRYVKTRDRDGTRERRSRVELCPLKLRLFTIVIAWFLIKARRTQKKIRASHLADQLASLEAILGWPPRQRPRDRDHRLCRLALFPIPVEPAPCRGNAL
jgi:hypothetical protein